MNSVFSSLSVNATRMRENLQRSQGLPMAEAVMTKLVEKGLGRGEAHEVLRQCSLRASTDGRSLLDVLAATPQVTKVMTPEELRQAMEPASYLGATRTIVDTIVAKLSR
jgi:adenylosuccinate lyase